MSLNFIFILILILILIQILIFIVVRVPVLGIIFFLSVSNPHSYSHSVFTFIYIYIYAFSRRFYPKRLTEYSGYTFIISTCVSWESNPQPFALLTQCSTTEPQEHILILNMMWLFSFFLHSDVHFDSDSYSDCAVHSDLHSDFYMILILQNVSSFLYFTF